ncbi:MAG: DUF4835 family protein [Haliscomenobacter sp.]|uniref:type IX secretion system protein PorD n=1 Tax=Haliscomenobacter sp. TaxID=2717303 RepID=UPI0029ABA3FD|nr:DUF4835 family protein [Haliscomenobacter sp.]MDX2069348.1 DUF4835 family protein [Haliscomenobacter sp.]
MRNFFIPFVLFFAGLSMVQAQELNFTTKVNIQRLLTADPAVFNGLEQALREFVNSSKWTEDDFRQEERIKGNILLTITGEATDDSQRPIPNVYTAELAIQASRPIYGTNNETTLFNYIDREVTFKYEQFQPLQFSKSVFNDNLSQVVAFYIHIILGMDYDSFSLNGGSDYFQAAQQIVNVAQSASAVKGRGWSSIEGNNRNRFWISENWSSPRMKPMRELQYAYHRLGLDQMSQDPAKGRSIISQTLENARKSFDTYPNTILMQLFLSSKSKEITEIFKIGTPDEKDRVADIMSRIDPTNANNYRQLRQ